MSCDRGAYGLRMPCGGGPCSSTHAGDDAAQTPPTPRASEDHELLPPWALVLVLVGGVVLYRWSSDV